MRKTRIINIAYAVLTDGRRFLAYAPHLNLVGYGRTSEEAEKDFDAAVNAFFKFHEMQRNLHSKLINLGFKFIDHSTNSPKDFTVPTDLLANATITSSGTRAHALA